MDKLPEELERLVFSFIPIETLALCNENHIKVVPQGCNTGLVGGSVPSYSLLL